MCKIDDSSYEPNTSSFMRVAVDLLFKKMYIAFNNSRKNTFEN